MAKVGNGSPREPEITGELVSEHGLSEEEYARVLQILGRKPTYTELGIFSVMWSEHCSYKSSKVHLKKLPTTGPRVLQGPGENAGIVDIGDGQALVFKMESHNHPSYIEPYQGAATGVGGILRDIFTMGARPVASLDSLRFGPLDQPRMCYLVERVVEGIADYGNCMGVPTVGGEMVFDPSYAGNILVNVFTLGVMKRDRIFRAAACGTGNPVIYVGAKTGCDGVHGATMASEEFDEGSEERRPTVQVGDPFTEKLLLEACLELVKTDWIVGMQDMGAAGLTCSTFEMASRGGTGMVLDLTKVPRRQEGMSPYEVMLSESQERMLIVARRGLEDKVISLFRKWDLDAVEIGEVTADGVMRVRDNGRLVVEAPVKPLVEDSPVYDRPERLPDYLEAVQSLDLARVAPPVDCTDVLMSLMGSPNLASKRWVYTQYDHMVRTNTMVGPGSDAGVIRLKGTTKAVGFTSDGNGRYCYLDPYAGALATVAEAARNLICVGTRPVGLTDCLNFGNPERPEIMWQFARAVEGLSAACRALGIPVVSGNVSFYNETQGVAVYPTPVVGMVGLAEDCTKVLTQGFKQEGDRIALLGETREELGGSEYLAFVHGLVRGCPPAVDLVRERAVQEACWEAIQGGLLKSAHDCSDGGLAVALAECCLSGRDRMGASVELEGPFRVDALLFGETQSRIVVSLAAEDYPELERICGRWGVPVRSIGTAGGERVSIRLVGGGNVLCAAVAELAELWENAVENALGKYTVSS